MNINNIIRIASEIKELRERADELEKQLTKEINQAKSVFPTDFGKKQEFHSDKYQIPPHIMPQASPYWLGGYPTALSEIGENIKPCCTNTIMC